MLLDIRIMDDIERSDFVSSLSIKKTDKVSQALCFLYYFFKNWNASNVSEQRRLLMRQFLNILARPSN